MEENQISGVIVDAAIKVHRALGPGLFESVYEAVLAYELGRRGVSFARQVPLAVIYEGIQFDDAYRIDLLVADRVLVELKSVEQILPIHRKQLLTYVKLKGVKLGLLLNFGEMKMLDGIERIVNGL